MQTSLVLFLALTGLSHASPLPLYGRNLPLSFADDATMQQLSTKLDTAFHQVLKSSLAAGHSYSGNETSFSFAVFDANQTLYQFNHVADESTLDPASATTVDEHTVFRIGSTSKLLTVYTFLAKLGWKDLHSPITEYVPELAERAKQCSAAANPYDCTDWNQVTLHELASQMAGIPRDFEPQDDGEDMAEKRQQNGYPPSILSPAQQFCGTANHSACSRQIFAQGLADQHPVAAVSDQPLYSNGAFQLLADAFEKISGTSFPQTLQTFLFDGLNMTDSYSSLPPPTAHGMVPAGASQWNNTFSQGGPEGGMYSSSADLVKLGQSILNHDFLSPTDTRRWLRPVAHTASLRLSVGMPWEIYRRSPLPDDTLHSVDCFAKAGDIGAYHTDFVLVPQYGIGYALLNAGSGSGVALQEATVASLLNTLDALAHAQARRNLAGTYHAAVGTGTLVLSVEDHVPGVNVTTLTSNGTDLLTVLRGGWQDHPLPGQIRAYPSGLMETTAHGTREAWRLVCYMALTWENERAQEYLDAGWEMVDDVLWSYTGTDELLVETGEGGEVVGVEMRLWGGWYV